MAKKINTEWRNRIVSSGTMAASQFVANPSNWRIHPKAQREALSGVLNEVGWVQNVIVNKTTGNVVDGHARIEEALKRGDDTPVPYVEVELTEDEEQKILLTLDPISAMAAADKANLDALLKSVETQDAAVMAMIADMADKAGLDYGDSNTLVDAEPQIDKAEELRVKWGVELGQLWQLGEHRLLCGDSTKADDVARLMGGEKADAVVTDPPYEIDTNVVIGAINMFAGRAVILTGGKQAFSLIGGEWEYHIDFVWRHRQPRSFPTKYQPVFYHHNILMISKRGVKMNWERPKSGTPSVIELQGKEFDRDEIGHAKTPDLFAAMMDGVNAKLWADPFCGAGTSVLACQKSGFKMFGMELNAATCAVALERFLCATGIAPTLNSAA